VSHAAAVLHLHWLPGLQAGWLREAVRPRRHRDDALPAMPARSHRRAQRTRQHHAARLRLSSPAAPRRPHCSLQARPGMRQVRQADLVRSRCPARPPRRRPQPVPRARAHQVQRGHQPTAMTQRHQQLRALIVSQAKERMQRWLAMRTTCVLHECSNALKCVRTRNRTDGWIRDFLGMLPPMTRFPPQIPPRYHPVRIFDNERITARSNVRNANDRRAGFISTANEVLHNSFATLTTRLR